MTSKQCATTDSNRVGPYEEAKQLFHKEMSTYAKLEKAEKGLRKFKQQLAKATTAEDKQVLTDYVARITFIVSGLTQQLEDAEEDTRSAYNEVLENTGDLDGWM